MRNRNIGPRHHLPQDRLELGSPRPLARLPNNLQATLGGYLAVRPHVRWRDAYDSPFQLGYASRGSHKPLNINAKVDGVEGNGERALRYA